MSLALVVPLDGSTAVRCRLADPTWSAKLGPELFVPRRSGSVVANQDMQRPVIIRNVIPIDDITEQVIRRTADKEAEIGFDV